MIKNRLFYGPKVGIVLFAAMILGGCTLLGGQSPVRNHQKDYVHAQSVPPLKMPPGVTLTGVKDRYPLTVAKAPLTHQPSLIPPGNTGSSK